MVTVLCADPWKWPAVKRKVGEQDWKCQWEVLQVCEIYKHVNSSVYIFVIVHRSRTTGAGGVELSEREQGPLLVSK